MSLNDLQKRLSSISTVALAMEQAIIDGDKLKATEYAGMVTHALLVLQSDLSRAVELPDNVKS